MKFADNFKNQIFSIDNASFNEASIEIFNYQYHNNKIYKKFCDSLKRDLRNIKKIEEIPFLPIDLFKNHAIKSGEWIEEKIFKSSGTTSSQRSKHYIKNVDFYLQNTLNIFNELVGTISDNEIIALLPSYQEQGDSSLICMVDHFMRVSHQKSFYALDSDIKDLLESNQKKILIGVSYALWDLSNKNITPKNTLVIETGGMKGRKKEIVRSELHSILCKGLNQKVIWSEYGMTELQSQAYGVNGYFKFPKWAKAFIRDINDPFHFIANGKTGGLNIIDLANIDSCSFIETKDLGRSNEQYFEVLGRFDNSDIRGCNLMI